MIKVISMDRKVVVLEEIQIIDKVGNQSLNWYNPVYKGFTNVRTVKYLINSSKNCIDKFLQNPNLRIYTLLSHKPMLSIADEDRIRNREITRSQLHDIQRIMDKDEPYIDEFGFYVYLTSRLGTSKDLDLRYDTELQAQTTDDLITLNYIL